jgi:hypothetical protein
LREQKKGATLPRPRCSRPGCTGAAQEGGLCWAHKGHQLDRHVEVRRENRKRKAAERPRQFGELSDWVVTLPCHNCGRLRGIAPAHVVGRRLAGAWGVDGLGNLLPLCEDLYRPGCHNIQHARGWGALESIGSLEAAKEAAAEYGARFRRERGAA